VILAAGLSGVTVLISMLFDPAPDAEGRELIQAYAANDRAQGLHTNLIHYGFALFAPVAYAMVGLVRRWGAWIANLAGLLAVLGLSTLPGWFSSTISAWRWSTLLDLRRLSTPRERLRSFPVSPP
jgi:hypothetical protein